MIEFKLTNLEFKKAARTLGRFLFSTQLGLFGSACLPMPEYKVTQYYSHCGTADGSIPRNYLVHVEKSEREAILGVFKSPPKYRIVKIEENTPHCTSKS